MSTNELAPRKVPQVRTKYRRIVTDIPVPESIPILQKLRQFEPVSMSGQPPILWDRAEGIQVYDRWGNMWLDWSSGVLVTNAGHGHPKIRRAIQQQVEHGLLHNYCFPSEIRAQLTEALARVAPEGLKKVFLLTTGAEACECAIKLARTHGRKVGGDKKIAFVTFHNAFHGRTLGAQMAGGIPALKDWIVNLDKDFIQVPFPDGFRGPDTSFDGFLNALKQQGFTPDRIAGVMTETYQGGNASFAPPQYVQKLRAWCDEHKVLLAMDEVQAGFGRTGKLAGYQHYGIVPDLSTWGKGISSSLPISCVIGRADVMDLHPAGSMTSTHTGNPLCCAAALANIEIIEREGLVDRAARLGAILLSRLHAMKARHPQIGCVDGKGMVAAIACVKPGTTEPDADLAWAAVQESLFRGVLMFSPVGFGGGAIKICPPLSIPEDALAESLDVFEEAFASVVAHSEVA
ncbi:MAG: aspartate aminotransferase family protein [Pirellulales bacterium]|nr:aspartate aminotransferase family protein [Pirellulales bacterium]